MCYERKACGWGRVNSADSDRLPGTDATAAQALVGAVPREAGVTAGTRPWSSPSPGPALSHGLGAPSALLASLLPSELLLPQAQGLPFPRGAVHPTALPSHDSRVSEGGHRPWRRGWMSIHISLRRPQWGSRRQRVRTVVGTHPALGGLPLRGDTEQPWAVRAQAGQGGPRGSLSAGGHRGGREGLGGAGALRRVGGQGLPEEEACPLASPRGLAVRLGRRGAAPPVSGGSPSSLSLSGRAPHPPPRALALSYRQDAGAGSTGRQYQALCGLALLWGGQPGGAVCPPPACSV